MDAGGSRHPGRALRVAADYGWRFLVLAGSGYVLLRILRPVYDLVIVVVVAVLITALLHPVLTWFRRRGLSRRLATAASVLFAVVVVGGILTYVIIRGIQDFPALGDQINRLIPHVKHWLIHGPLHLNPDRVNHLGNTLSQEISKNSSAIANSAIQTGRTVLSVLAGIVLGIFVTIFLLYDGERVWGFVVGLFPADARPRVTDAGAAVWRTLSNYIRGTLIVAIFHGVVIAIALQIVGVPLVAPLALLVGLGAFVPLVGAVVTGALAVAVAGLTHGWAGAIVIFAVLIVDNQVEGHLLQPFVVGRYVRIHPLATVLALAAGGLLLGIFGAIIAVPVAACVNAGAKALVADRPSAPDPEPRPPPADEPEAAPRS